MSVRVRYAPSPTGLQHIGSARTALFNYLFARSKGGAFVLRIEDTDRKRFVPEALQDTYDTYAWLGLHWDEGPDVGGPRGPYLQSERTALYRRYAEQLVAAGGAYRCWCSTERLADLRKSQQQPASDGSPADDTEPGEEPDGSSVGSSTIGYDRHCRNLPAEERRRLEASGAPSVIRLAIPLEGETRGTDELIGGMSWKNTDINPDPVLLKSDGFPTYHFANVIDDHLMEITDILRAQEWLSSLPIHVILYRALGWPLPRYTHLPMVLGADGRKLGKRHGATSVREFRRLGYLPEAVVNYLALVGWSYDDQRQLFTLRDLEQLFDPAKLNKAAAIFDYQKLDWFNGTYIRAKSRTELAGLIHPFLAEAGAPEGRLREAGFLEGVAGLVQERVKRLSEAPAMVRYLFEEVRPASAADLIPKKADAAKAVQALEALRAFTVTGDEAADEAEARRAADSLGLKFGDLMMCWRVAVTGSKVSPPLFPSLRLMGRAGVEEAAERAIELLRGADTLKERT